MYRSKQVWRENELYRVFEVVEVCMVGGLVYRYRYSSRSSSYCIIL